MTPLLFALLAVAGGLGAALRVVVDGVVRSRLRFALPLGTMIINVSGSFLLGLVTALAAGGAIPGDLLLVLGAGLLGGYTTFSTASVETVRLMRDGRYRDSLVNGPGMLVLAVLAAAAGWALGSLVR
ncbi:MAG: fluoride efflux transporter CrcB [Burkholderiaceae bacterium]|nr:fluoride efflux transporter CrcB [Microbacteriaceae bacterium]